MSTAARTFPCQAVGCAVEIGRGQFLCRGHWYGLPQPLRQHVNATWSRRKAAMKSDARDTRAILDHVEACDEARRYTADKEDRLDSFHPDADRLKRLYALSGAEEADDHG